MQGRVIFSKHRRVGGGAGPWSWRFLLLFAFAVCIRPALAVTPEVTVRFGPAPSWVVPAPVVDGEANAASGGVSYLLGDRQARFARGEAWRFRRLVMKVTTEAGLQEVGQRRFNFTPPHERLVLHKLETRRESQVFSHLKEGAVRVLQREPGLEGSAYSGARTALVLLSDVRVGDVITSESSVVGQNTIFGDHVLESWELEQGVPLARLRFSLLSERPLEVRAFAGGRLPLVDETSGLHRYLWEATDVSAGELADGLPEDYFAVPWLAFSDFANWVEVRDWGLQLFQVSESLPKSLLPVVERLRKSSTDPGQRVSAALRWVQEEIRYFSLAFAENTHRPAPPQLVLERRFGDCKDKTLLMLTLLRALGVDADVALVNTALGRRLPELLPGIDAFNHAIVRVTLGGKSYFLDPTRSYQRGGLDQVAVRGLGYALLLSAAQSELVPIPEQEDPAPDIHSRLSFVVEEFGGKTSLFAATTYGGARAEWLRSLRLSDTASELSKAVREPVLNAYPQATATGELEFADDEVTNRVTVTQSYALDQEWSSGTERSISLRSPCLFGRLPEVRADRRTPIALLYPLSIVQDMDVTLPSKGAFRDEEREIGSEDFRLHTRVRNHRHQTTLHYEFSSLSPSVTPDHFAKYRSEREQAIKWLDWQLTEPRHAPALDAGADIERAFVLLLTLPFVGVLLGLIVFVHLKAPYFKRPRVRFRPRLRGMNGALIWLALAVTLAPLLSLLELLKVQQASWAAHSRFTFLLQPVATLAMSAYVAYLFYGRKRSFPWLFVVSNAVFGADLLLQALLGGLGLVAVGLGVREVTSLCVSLLWSTYVLQSERVKARFLPDPRERSRAKREPRRSAASEA